MPTRQSLATRQVTAARRNQSAFSILEILVALVIGVVVLLALTDIVTTSKVSYLREENVARMQESGRFATLMIAEDIRPTRSLDCYITGLAAQSTTLSVKACSLLTTANCTGADPETLLTKHVLTAETPLAYDAADYGNDDSWLVSLPPNGRDNVKARYLRGDVLVTWGLAGTSVPVTAPVPYPAAATDGIEVKSTNGLVAGDIAVISDCAGTDVFAVSSMPEDATPSTPTLWHNTPENAVTHLSAAYNRPETAESGGRRYAAQVSALRYTVYYVCCVDTASGELDAKDPRGNCDNTKPEYRPALCTWEANRGNTQVIVPDVADLRLTFGSAVDATTAFSADDTAEIHTAKWVTTNKHWPDVASVNVELLVASPDEGRAALNAARKPASVDWPPNPDDATTADGDTLGAAIITADTRLYRRFVINLAVRARTPWYLSH